MWRSLHTSNVGVVTTESYNIYFQMSEYKAACVTVQSSSHLLSIRKQSIFVNLRIEMLHCQLLAVYLSLLLSVSVEKKKNQASSASAMLRFRRVKTYVFTLTMFFTLWTKSSVSRWKWYFASTESKGRLHFIQYFLAVSCCRSLSVLQCHPFDCIHPTPTFVQISSFRLPQAT